MQKQAPEMEALELLAVRVDMLVTEARSAIEKAETLDSIAEFRTALQSLDDILRQISAATLEAYETATVVRDRAPGDGDRQA